MRHFRRLILFSSLFSLIYLINISYAIPSGGVFPPEFTYRNGDWYDSWNYNRNYYAGTHGYLPNVAYESLGRNREMAYEIGEKFREDYDDRVNRAEAILDYVQEWTEYGYDKDNVVKNGDPQEEWAWNADEMAHMFDRTTHSVAIGDCEDMAFLCATIYMASNIESALVDAPGHVALLIWLPEYDNPNYYWDIPDDGREYGWIWVEATGEANPLGWTPNDFSNGDWNTHILGFSKFNVEYSPRNPRAEDEVTVEVTVESEISSITQVNLSYETGGNPYEIPMTKRGSHYEATIPQQPDGTKVIGKVQVTDRQELTSEQTFEYTVGQEKLPPYLVEAGIILLIIALLFFGLAFTR